MPATSSVTIASAQAQLAQRASTLTPLHTFVRARSAHGATSAIAIGPTPPGAAIAGIDQADVLTPFLGRFVDSRA